MKLWIAALLLVFMGFSSEISSDDQNVEEEKIKWSEQKLTWNEFKGTPSGPEEFVASTNSGVGFSFSYKERNGVGQVTYSIDCNFYPNLSWYRSDRVSPYILGHEQLHFDISELHARKLRKSLSSLPQNRDFKTKAKKLYDAMEVERRAMQNQYDTDSDHSNVESEEYRWRAYVKEELIRLEAWK